MGKRRNTTRKALRMESLEARQLMAADIGLHHGILNVRGTQQDDVIKMEQVQVGQSNQENSIIKVSVANKRGRVLKAAQFDGRAVKKIKAYGFNGHDRIVNRTDIPSYLNGGKGNDVLQGGAAADKVFGSYGNDTLSGGGGNDRLYGKSGKDTLRGGAGHDKLYGGSGSDRIYGNSGNDYVSGGSGHDRIYGCGGDDVLHGGSGNDLIRGADGKDHLYAGVGRDKLYGDRGQDVLHKSSSRDRASGGQGRDRIKHDAKATSTAAARKVHEAAQEKLEAKISSDKIDKITSQLVDSILAELKEKGSEVSRGNHIKGIPDSAWSTVESLTEKDKLSNKKGPLDFQSGRTTVKGSRGSQVSEGTDDWSDEWAIAGLVNGTVALANASTVGQIANGLAFLWAGAYYFGKNGSGDYVSGIPDAYFEARYEDSLDKTPNPQDDETGGSGRPVFAPGSFLGNQEIRNKWSEIVSNMSGYGLWDPNPADESESGGGVHNPKNHDDGDNHVKEKAESSGSAKDIMVSAGGGVTDPPIDKGRFQVNAKNLGK